jgi:hypothetical protein
LQHADAGYFIPVYAGYGPPPNDNDAFLAQNPAWPKKPFGMPVPTAEYDRQMYNLQGEAYADLLSPTAATINYKYRTNKRFAKSAINAMYKAVKYAKRTGKLLNIVSIGPLNNIAALIGTHPDAIPYIKVWHMGGWFNDESGSVLRAGYNTGISPFASSTVFQSGAQIVIVSSDFVATNRIEITKDHDLWSSYIANSDVITSETATSQWAAAVAQDWHNWNSKFLFGDRIHFADVLTAFIALRELDEEAEGYQLCMTKLFTDHEQYGPRGFLATGEDRIIDTVKCSDSPIRVLAGKMEDETRLNAMKEILETVETVLTQQ